MDILWLEPKGMPRDRPFLAWVDGFGPVTISWDPNPPKGSHWKAVSLEAWFGPIWIVGWWNHEITAPASHLFAEQRAVLRRYVETGEEPAP